MILFIVFFKDAASWLARFRQMNDITEIKSYVCESEHDKHVLYKCEDVGERLLFNVVFAFLNFLKLSSQRTVLM